MSDYPDDNSEASQSDAPTNPDPADFTGSADPEADPVSNTVTFFAGGESVIKSLESGVVQLPRVVLQDVESDQGEPLAKPNSPAMPTVGDQVGRYQLIGEIARGGMGAVLRGRDTDLGRDLAIKVLLDDHDGRPDVLQRFVEEAQISGQLQHPGIAPVYELGQFADQRPFFSMKLVKGKTLSALLSDRATPEEDRSRFLGIFEQVCQTVAYAHSRGVIHRDIKPSNVMVGSFGEVQVMDWGLAKVLKAGGVEDDKRVHQSKEDLSVIRTIRSEQVETPGYGSETHAGSVLGTPAYMAPEQAMGEVDQLDERADLFGLGAMLCEILTGKPPYVADTGNKVFKLAIRANLDDAFQRLDDCGADADIIQLTKQCLSVEPVDRPRDAGVLADHIAEYFESVREQLTQAKLAAVKAEAHAAAEHKRRRVTLTLASALVATLVMAAAGWEFVSHQNAVRELEAVEQHARLTTQITSALADAELYRAKAEAMTHNDPLPLLQAQQAVARAETLAATGDVHAGLLEQIDSLKQSLAAEATDRQVVAALERARTERVEMKGRLHKASFEQITNAYRTALAEFGIKVGEDSANAVAAAIQERRDFVKTALVAAIDDWLLLATRGAGIRVRMINGQHVITSVATDGPAQTSGILKDDILLGVSADGSDDDVVPLRGKSVSEVLEMLAGTMGKPLLLQVMTPIPAVISPRSKGQPSASPQPRNVSLTRGRDLRSWLRDIAVQIDPNAWRIRLRFAVDQMETEELLALAVEKSAITQPSSAIVSLALALVESGEHGAGINLLKQAQRKQPHDFWINYTLGTQLHYSNPPQYRDAIRFYTAALAIRPQSAGIGLNLGDVYDGAGELDEAIASYRNAVDAQPDDEQALMSLGAALTKRVNDDTQLSLQIAAADVGNDNPSRMFADNVELASRDPVDDPLTGEPRGQRFPIRSRPKPQPPGAPEATVNADTAVASAGGIGQPKGIRNTKPKGVEFKPGDFKAESLPSKFFGKTIGRMSIRDRFQSGRSVVEAEQVLRKAVKVNPESAEARCCLAKVLQHKGQYADAVEHFRKGHELAEKSGSSLPTAEFLADAECLAAWGKNLEALLKKSVTGEIDNEFRGRMCQVFKHSSMTATKLFTGTQLDDEFLHDVYRGHRLASARTAVLAANISWPREGVSVDATEIDKQAAAWLDADLKVIADKLQTDLNDTQRAAISRMLQQWRGNSVFASVKSESGKKRFPKLAVVWDRAGKMIAELESQRADESNSAAKSPADD